MAKRIILLGLVVFTMLGTAFAQTAVTTRIVTVPAGLYIDVDGQTYVAPLTFTWPEGSRHTLHGFDQATVEGSTKSAFGGFSTNKGAVTTVDQNTIIVTANRDISEIDATFATTYRVRVVYFDCTGYVPTGAPCPPNISPGTVTVNGNTFTQSGVFYAPAGVLNLQAVPSPPDVNQDSPWIFVGWYNGLGNDSQAFLNTVNITGPTSIYPRFVHGRRLTIQSTPPGLQILADRQPLNTPSTLIWGTGTLHALGSVPDQMDNHGKLWVFDSWSDGGGINHSYQVPEGLVAYSVTANFVPGQRVSFYTNPPGLTLSVDGRSNWLSNNFAWAVNSTHTVSAPATQTDDNGTNYTFRNWSQGGDATQVITATQDPNGLNLSFTANYDAAGRISVISQTPGIVIQVDGQDCALPCTIEKKRGASIRLRAPVLLQLSEDSRLDFLGWNDSGDAERTIATPGGPLTLNLNYRLRNRLNIAATPPEGARVVTDPVAADGFFDAQSEVQVSIETKLGFKFHNWDGDFSGTSRTLAVNMNAPRYVRAILDRVPALVDRPVRNAAGDTPLDAVAAGSIVSILGVNLAAELKVGPSSPLSQTLNDVTVSIGGRLLPLVFVSPEQINAQLPSDLADGVYTLTVRWQGKPDVSADFTVARNAPGLYNRVVDGRAFGLFLHENGEAVTADSPARRHEIVTLLGTGLGPYLQAPPDGFATPESPAYTLADAVTILAADGTIDSLYAGVADGRIGVTAIRFRIEDNLPGGANTEIKVRVLDRVSNTVLLPVE